MKKGICYGVSVGPGGEELITLEALHTIEMADVIFLPSFPKEECKAYQIIKRIMPEIDDKELRAETFTMSRDASVASNRHDEIFQNVCLLLDEGKNVAFLTLGEVALFSTYLYIHDRLVKAEYESVFISGISSIQAISQKLSLPLAIGKQELHIFPDASNLKAKLTCPGTKVFMKPRGNMEEMISQIQDFVESNPEYKACGVSNCGMPGEIVAKDYTELSKLSGYFTVIIVTGDNPGFEPNASYFENRSCPYYPCHKGIEHMNCLFCYCPMYRFENCLGNPTYIEKEDKRIKNCTGCTFPHVKSHYGDVIDFLKNQ